MFSDKKLTICLLLQAETTVRMMGNLSAASLVGQMANMMVSMMDCYLVASLAKKSAELMVKRTGCLWAVNLVVMTAEMMARMMGWLSADLKAQPKAEMMVSSLVEEMADAMVRMLDCSLDVPCIHIFSSVCQELPWEKGRHTR